MQLKISGLGAGLSSQQTDPETSEQAQSVLAFITSSDLVKEPLLSICASAPAVRELINNGSGEDGHGRAALNLKASAA